MMVKFNNQLLPRFRTKEDGLKYMECVQLKKPLPTDIWIWPFIQVEGTTVVNPEYADAPFEAKLLP